MLFCDHKPTGAATCWARGAWCLLWFYLMSRLPGLWLLCTPLPQKHFYFLSDVVGLIPSQAHGGRPEVTGGWGHGQDSHLFPTQCPSPAPPHLPLGVPSFVKWRSSVASLAWGGQPDIRRPSFSPSSFLWPPRWQVGHPHPWFSTGLEVGWEPLDFVPQGTLGDLLTARTGSRDAIGIWCIKDVSHHL